MPSRSISAAARTWLPARLPKAWKRSHATNVRAISPIFTSVRKRGPDIYVHEDVKQRLLDDVRALMAAARIERMDGVIVTGDIAFSGKKSEYDRAAFWLDQLTGVIGCKKTDVLVVPGNHDIDRARISAGAELMLQRIVEGGNNQLDRFLADTVDREVLYAKFHDYRAFAEGYDCPLGLRRWRGRHSQSRDCTAPPPAVCGSKFRAAVYSLRS